MKSKFKTMLESRTNSFRARAQASRIRHQQPPPPRRVADKDGICMRTAPQHLKNESEDCCAGTIFDSLHNNSLRCAGARRKHNDRGR